VNERTEKSSRKGSRERDAFADLRKTQQLCSEVREVLSFVLAGDCEDPILQQLVVREVMPAPDASRLLVVLTLPEAECEQADHAMEALRQLRGYLRSQIADEIQRKRTPDLSFQIMPESAGPETASAG
jgi:ribosome-binding factor A